jgi:hypothetical protein
MKSLVCGLAAGLMVALASGATEAQQSELIPHRNAAGPIPRFERFRTLNPSARAFTSATLPTWTFNWTYASVPYSATMVGSAPTGAGTKIPVYIIPVKIVIGSKSFSPMKVQSNGKTALANTQNSPLLKSSLTFMSGGTNLGATQYIDAYQRGNFWHTVMTNTGWHTKLVTPTVLALKTITVASGQGATATAFGANVGLVNINWIDPKLQTIMINAAIPANAIPIFVMYNTYLTDGSPTLGNCCIGGYHSYNGVQTYMQFTYIGTPGAFAQDVAALSHEIGEWYDDPFVNNNSPCGILENGDPLENEANFGDYTYVLGGFAYHLQDLVYMPYFGAPANTSVGSQMTFQGTPLFVCQNGA